MQNITGLLRISEDGGLGLNVAIPEKNHGYGHAHEGVLNFLKKGLAISPGVNIIDFTAFVTGNNAPAVHFQEIENLILTSTSLVNANNVDPLIEDWAGDNVKDWALESATELDTPGALEVGPFLQTEIEAISPGAQETFVLRSVVQKDMDGTLAYIGGSWRKPEPAGQPTFTLVARLDPVLGNYNTVLTEPIKDTMIAAVRASNFSHFQARLVEAPSLRIDLRDFSGPNPFPIGGTSSPQFEGHGANWAAIGILYFQFRRDGPGDTVTGAWEQIAGTGSFEEEAIDLYAVTT